MTTEELSRRVDALLNADTVDAVVRDGWPRPMVEAGFELHRHTWDVEAMADGLQRELAELELRDVERASGPRSGEVEVPRSMTHVWPALPGAGVSPVLLAALLGVEEQRIRASSRGLNFARRFCDLFEMPLITELGDAERYVVSGSDETVATLCEQLGEQRVVGYGDRQSFAVIVDDGDATRHVDALATDIVMWFGRGCFSARALVFVGDIEAGERFGEALAAAIARREAELAPELDEAMLAVRAQGLAVAQFRTRVWPARLGWVELAESWDGSARPADVVVLCLNAEPDAALAVERSHRQAAAWAGSTPPSRHALGVTRVCAPGQLQAPPPDWPHDGVSNAAALLGLRGGRIGL